MIQDIIAGFFSGFLGSMGLGGGGILIIYLTIFRNMPQINAQGINLIFFIPIALLSIIMHTRNKIIDWQLAFKYIIYAFIGLAIGYCLLNIINEGILRKVFSIILISIGIKELFKKDK